MAVRSTVHIGREFLAVPPPRAALVIFAFFDMEADTAILRSKGYEVGRQKISELLDELGYSLQGNRKAEEGDDHPDRDAQFRFINRRVKIFQRFGQPVISVDTKKKELIGNFANKGKEREPKGNPRKVDTHDFGKDRVNPYGVYDQTR
ncbi:MAG: hypothetical protein HY881_01220 [Deltaproteobacteria bacterium]|nr:hypothetical protein [Deltaproteobacteria bacterium]